VRILSERWPGKIPGAFRNQLVMSAAVASTTAVESAVIAATRVAAVVSVITAVVASADEAVGVATPVAMIAAMSVVALTSVVTVAIVAATTVEAAAIIAAVVPGAGADEDAAGEVVRPVVAVWSAGVRIVTVVTISAGRGWPDGAVHWTYSNAHRKLCVSISRGEKQNPQQSNIFKVTHCVPSIPA
jgi:hypothetical protein